MSQNTRKDDECPWQMFYNLVFLYLSLETSAYNPDIVIMLICFSFTHF